MFYLVLYSIITPNIDICIFVYWFRGRMQEWTSLCTPCWKLQSRYLFFTVCFNNQPFGTTLYSCVMTILFDVAYYYRFHIIVYIYKLHKTYYYSHTTYILLANKKMVGPAAWCSKLQFSVIFSLHSVFYNVHY